REPPEEPRPRDKEADQQVVVHPPNPFGRARAPLPTAPARGGPRQRARLGVCTQPRADPFSIHLSIHRGLTSVSVGECTWGGAARAIARDQEKHGISGRKIIAVGAGLRPRPVAPPTVPRLVGPDLAHHTPKAGTGHHPHNYLQGDLMLKAQRLHRGACLSPAQCHVALGLRACSVTGDQSPRRLTIIEAELAPPVFSFFPRHRSSAHASAPLKA